MSSFENRYSLQRDGVVQTQRMLESLKPENVPVDGRSHSDFKEFAEKYAELIRYFNEKGEISNWNKFFDSKSVSESTPHYALFVTFLELFRYSQDHINRLTKKHLDFFYNEVLRIEKKEAEPDQVHIIFELAKNVEEHLLKADRTVFIGKNDLGQEISYRLDKDIVINKAQVSSIKSVFVDKTNGHTIFAAPVANSADGLGKPLEGEEPKWYGFGKPQYERASEEEKLLPIDQRTMQDAGLGFAIASPILFLREGDRTITITLELEEKKIKGNSIGTPPGTNEFTDSFSIYLSGEDEWIQPEDVDISFGSKHLQIVVRTDIMTPSIVSYNSEVLGGNFDTDLPLMKLMVNQGHYEKLGAFNIINATISVDARNIYNNILESNNSALDPNKPFLPFGPIPEKGFELRIGNSEVFQKKLDSLKLNIKWSELPDFDELYQNYPEDVRPAKENFMTEVQILNEKKWHSQSSVHLFESSNTGKERTSKIKVERSRFEIFKGKGKQHPHYFRLIDDSGNIVLRSEGYKYAKGPEQGIESVRKHALSDEQYIRKIASNGTFFFSLIASNKEIIGVSQFFKEPEEREASIEIVKKIVTEARIVYKPQESDETEEPEAGMVAISLGAIENFDRSAELRELTSWDRSVPRGFMKLVLKSGFGHKEFPRAYSDILLLVGKTVDGKVISESDLPSEPYTPNIEALSLDYSSTETIDLSVNKEEDKAIEEDRLKDMFNNRVDRFFHIGPFGEAEKHPHTSIDIYAFPLLPEFKNEGTLYIGIEDLKPNNTLNILFQIAEGSSIEPEFEEGSTRGAIVEWSYMTNNQWVRFDDLHILADNTNQFQTSGIISFDLPAHATKNNTFMPAELHWLRATVSDHSESLCQLIELKTQATIASFINNENDANHLMHALKKNSISKLATKDAAIKSITQPYASFNGKPSEQRDAFYTRVSEQLRHKNRAITIWDYERIILEKFPSIYKVRCLNHTDRVSELKPGSVTLIVIQNVRNKNAVNPLQPKASLNTLHQIKNYLSGFISSFVTLEVLNPTYEEVLADFSVGFKEGYDRGFYGQKLNQEIKEFLSPWAFDQEVDMTLTGRVHKSAILKFIKSRKYVDFVNQFRLYHIKKGIRHIGVGIGLMTIEKEEEFIVSMKDTEIVEASSSRVVLVSAENHTISVVNPGDVACKGGDLGIGHMMIDVNFEVN